MINKESDNIYQVNNILRTYNWQFIHPYMQGYKINTILNRHTAGQLTADFVSDFFIRDFYDLPNTLSSIDGYFKRSPHVEPCCYFIEHSLILCFQRDYAGAINTLLPCVEGILASYLQGVENIDLSKNRFEKIKKATGYLKRKLVENIEAHLKDPTLREPDYIYNRQQNDHLLKQERKYYDDWFDSIERFLQESLFASTDIVSPDVELNRHSILHSLELKPYDTLVNYVKLFNCLRFLIWAFLKLERKSLLNNIDNDTFLLKMLMYEDIIKGSEKLFRQKRILMKAYPLYNPENLNKKILPKGLYSETSLKLRLLFKMKTWLLKRTG